MDFLIRPAVYGDAAALCGINSTSLGYDYPLALTRRNLEHVLTRGEDGIFVAVREGEVLGYIHGQPYTTLYHDPLVNVLALSVASGVQKNGVGRALLAHLENWARERGYSGVRLSSGMERAGAHVFYERCGYRPIKNHKTFRRDF